MKSSELKYPEFTASQLTSFALELMRLQNYRVRRVNNVAVYKKRKNQVEPGWPDIQGYDLNGKAVLCEVKTLNDTMSEPQFDRLEDCQICGGLAFVCLQIKNNAELITFKEYQLL